MQPPYVGEKEEEGGGVGGGGGPARTALRTLRANAECAYIGFHLYCFPFCHLLILWPRAIFFKNLVSGCRRWRLPLKFAKNPFFIFSTMKLK